MRGVISEIRLSNSKQALGDFNIQQKRLDDARITLKLKKGAAYQRLRKRYDVLAIKAALKGRFFDSNSSPTHCGSKTDEFIASHLAKASGSS